MHVVLKNIPRLRLADLLRRRKMTLAQFVETSGIQAYGALIERCGAMGVQPPTEQEYVLIVPKPVSSQQDGVVVLEPVEPTEEELVELAANTAQLEEPTGGPQKKQRKKKETLQES